MPDDFFTPIRPTDPSDQSRIPIPPIEADKQGKGPTFDLDQDDPRRQNLLYGSLVLFFKKMFTTALFSRTNRGSKSEIEVAQAIRTIKDLLTALKTCDQTDNPHYAQHLSDAWHTLLGAPPKTPVEPFIQLANTYPSGEAHSLGFYLTHYAGDHWLPFPFLEILKKLHQGYVLRKSHSELSHMLALIDEACSYFSL
ncbi:MAG: hypothetical protein KDK44_05690 [Chlamydiia bacterium]|nr:hypothetical protein [Chlamydiia bacterium]MCP5509332.1 hypothetical protein [Chlamydiales bacterium]